jgi:hypothetical protein
MIFAYHEYHAIDFREEATSSRLKDCSFWQVRGTSWLDYPTILDTFSSHCLHGRKWAVTRQR